MNVLIQTDRVYTFILNFKKYHKMLLIKPITKHNGKKEIINFYALTLHIYNNFDLCLSIYLLFIYKVW